MENVINLFDVRKEKEYAKASAGFSEIMADYVLPAMSPSDKGDFLNALEENDADAMFDIALPYIRRLQMRRKN